MVMINYYKSCGGKAIRHSREGTIRVLVSYAAASVCLHIPQAVTLME